MGICCMAQETQTGVLYQSRGVEWGGRWERVSEERIKDYSLHLVVTAFNLQIRSDQSLSHVRLFVIPWTTAHQASLSITNTLGPPKPMSIELVMPSNHLILCHPLLLPPSIFPSIRVFSNESALRIRWPKYWSFSFNISPSRWPLHFFWGIPAHSSRYNGHLS